jgi:hypothetical protein
MPPAAKLLNSLAHLAKQDFDKVKTESRKTGISLELAKQDSDKVKTESKKTGISLELAKQDFDKVNTESRKTGISLELTCWPRLATGWTVRGSNPGGDEIFRTRPYRPWGPRSLLYNGYWVSFMGIKRCGRGVNHPPHLAPRLRKE